MIDFVIWSCSAKFAAYEVEDDQLIKDLSSFALTNAIFTALVEGYAAEISARRNAMDNATTNSQTVIGGLQMKFNRMRQSKITNDLVDVSLFGLPRVDWRV